MVCCSSSTSDKPSIQLTLYSSCLLSIETSHYPISSSSHQTRSSKPHLGTRSIDLMRSSLVIYFDPGPPLAHQWSSTSLSWLADWHRPEVRSVATKSTGFRSTPFPMSAAIVLQKTTTGQVDAFQNSTRGEVTTARLGYENSAHHKVLKGSIGW